MLECTVRLDGNQVAHISMHEVSRLPAGRVAYRVDITIDKGASIGTHKRLVYGWPHEEVNPILLIKAALDLIDPAMATMEGETGGGSPDLARGLEGFVSEVQTRSSELYHNRPSVRSGQSEQHGRHSLGERTREEDSKRLITSRSDCYLQCGHGCTSAQNCWVL